MKKSNETFANNLRRYMKYYGYTQATLAKELGYGKSAVGYWVLGEKFPHLETIDKMAELFNCDRRDLIADESTADAIKRNEKERILNSYIEKLTTEGIERAIRYFEDLNPKYFKGGEED